MSSPLNNTEQKINDVVKGLPFQLPEKSRKAIVQYMPIITLILGILSLWAAYALWNSARLVDRLVDYSNALSSIYGGSSQAVSHLGVSTWIGILSLAVMGGLYIVAYPKLKSHSKAGWNLLFYGTLFNLFSGIVLIFDDYNGGVSSLIKSLFGTAVGLYFLFQIRSYYTDKK